MDRKHSGFLSSFSKWIHYCNCDEWKEVFSDVLQVHKYGRTMQAPSRPLSFVPLLFCSIRRAEHVLTCISILYHRQTPELLLSRYKYTLRNNTFIYFPTLRLLNLNVRHIHTSSSLLRCFHFMHLLLCRLLKGINIFFFANVPDSVNTVQTADCQFVCVCVLWWLWLSTNMASQRNKSC